jgi:hypothetical protein
MHFFFQTIAFQLGNTCQPLKLEISNVLEDKTILTSNLNVQFKKLILQPISKLQDLFPLPMVVVPDALDECTQQAHDNKHPISQIITILIRSSKIANFPFLHHKPS